MSSGPAHEKHDPRVLGLKAALLALWSVVTFGVAWFARDLQFSVAGWPFGYWVAAQGALLVFIAVVAGYAWAMDRLSPGDAVPPPGGPDA